MSEIHRKETQIRMLARLFATRAGLFLLAFILSTSLAAPAFAGRTSGIGLVDYRQKNFKVGDWVRYKIEVSNSNGNENVASQELRVLAEETFRGEPCTWFETLYGPDTTDYESDIMLVSNEAFKDPQADVRFPVYARMMMMEVDDQGVPVMVEMQRTGSRNPVLPDMSNLRGEVDTLGFEKVETPRGTLEGQIVRLHRKLRNPRDMADSTINRITDTKRTSWMSRKVPITSLVKDYEIEDWFYQAYKLGEVSTSAPEIPVSSETRLATVVAWGTGAKSDLFELWKKSRHKAPDSVKSP
jgi:hypothetical protein